MKNLVKGICMFLVCVMLAGCQGNSVEINPDENKETGVSAADFYEYELHEYLSWGGHVSNDNVFGLPLIGQIDEEKTESDSEILILHWTGFSGGDFAEKFTDELLEDMVDFAIVVKTNLIDHGYGQDVYIKVYNKGEVVGIVNNNGGIIKNYKSSQLDESTPEQLDQNIEQEENDEVDQETIDQVLGRSNPASADLELAEDIIRYYFLNCVQNGIEVIEYDGENVYWALLNINIDDESIDWQGLRQELLELDLDYNLVLGFNDADLMYDVDMKELIQTRQY